MKRFLVLFLLAFAVKVSAQTPENPPKSNLGIDTLMIQTVYVNEEGVELMEPIKTVRFRSRNRFGTETVYLSADPKVSERRVRRRIIPES